MPNKNDRRRNARRSRVGSSVPEPDLYEAPATQLDEHSVPVSLPCGCRISMRLQYLNGVLVYFAVVWSERNTFGKWVERYSCDSGHGYFHEHIWGHQKANDRRDIKPLYSQVDVQECFDPAYDRVQDRHEKDCRGD